MKLGKYKQAVAYIALAVALVVGSSIFNKAYYDKNARETTEKILESQHEACERGNEIRVVVHGSVRAAVEANQEHPVVAQDFQRQLNPLNSTPYVDTRTGKIDCDAAIPKVP